MIKAVIFLLFSSFLISAAESENLPADNFIEINEAIQQTITAETHPYIKNHIFLNYKKTLDDLYFLAPQHLLWTTPDNQNINAAFQLLANASSSGLNPEYYNLADLQKRWQQLNQQEKVSHTEYALLDTAISINLIHFLSDLHFGRIDPRTLKPNYNNKNNAITLIPVILEALNTHKIPELTHKVEPSALAYQQLKKALLDYQNKDTGRPIINLSYTSSLHPADQSQQITAIRQQLHILEYSTDENNISSFYDQDLANQIKQFQLHHGLNQDGIIGKNTIKALNIQPYQRIQMIKLALERFRWLPKTLASPLIMVNIPAFQLKAYYPDDKEIGKTQILNMKVIVGKSKKDKFKSPVFTANMYYLEFSPYWNIPKSIAFDEILPQLKENPLYLEEHNMELVSGFHDNETPLVYTEDSFEQLESGNLMLRQRPGKGNALGKVKFIFPNHYNVYLHDTPSRHLFRKSKRDLSHGCIRVEKPTELARFLLQSKPGWGQKEVIKAMNLSSPKRVRLNQSIPVIIYYSTVSIVQGAVAFYNDIYNYDGKLAKVLIQQNQVPATPSFSEKI